MMRYVERPPGPALSPWVDQLWYLSDAPDHGRERILPTGTLELVINLHEDEFRIYDSLDAAQGRRFSGAMVSGAYARCFVIDTREHASIIGVHFKPGGARPFIGLPARELANCHVDLEALWGPAARLLREQLCAATALEQRFAILEAALRQRAPKPGAQRVSSSWALRRLAAGASVADIAAELSLSHRRLIEVFGDDIGMTPKLFARVLRFQRVLAGSTGPEPNWSSLASLTGYCDQSHLIRECFGFSDLSPSELWRCRAVPVKENHIAVPAAQWSNSSNTSGGAAPKLAPGG